MSVPSISPTRRRAGALVLAAVALPATLWAQQNAYTLAGDDVAIYNLAGTVRVEPGSTAGVVVELTRGGAGAARLRVEQGELEDRPTLRIIYPEARIAYRAMSRGSTTELQVRDDGTFGDDDRDDDHGRRRGGRRVVISGSDGLEAWADLRIRVPAGREVAVHQAVGSVTVANVDGQLRIDAASAPVTATGTRGSLVVDVGSGSVRVSESRGNLFIDTGSGTVQITNVRGDEVSIDTGSGEVNASDVQAAELQIETGSGDVELTAVDSPRLNVETGSGTVTLDLRSDLQTLAVETGSGDVVVRAPAALGAELDIETGSGDIESDFELTVTKRARDHLVGRIGDGRGKISVETGSGSVRLVKAGG